VYRIACVDLLDCIAAADPLHGDVGLELSAVVAAIDHRRDLPLRGSAMPQRLTMGAVQKSQTT
jgi:hypothetical protein